MSRSVGSVRAGGDIKHMFRDPQVNFYVRDVDAGARFYCDLFGFVETFRTPKHGAAIHLELRRGQLLLGLVAMHGLEQRHGLAVGAGPPRAELVLWTDNVDEAYAVLMANGVRALSAPHDFLAGRLRAAWVADPDGNPVQLVTRRATEGNG